MRTRITRISPRLRRIVSLPSRAALAICAFKEEKGPPKAGGPLKLDHLRNPYFGAGFSNIFGSTVGLISSVISLPLPLV
jgi:hypothetical protein